MSFYDDASFIFDAGAAAGKDGKAYNVKPVEELSSTEVVINGGFSIDGPGTDGELGTAYGDYGWNTVSPSAGTQEGTTTISNGVLKLTNASGETDSRAYAIDGVSSRNVITTNTYYKLVYTIVENNGCTSFKVYNAGGVLEDAPSSVGTHTVTLRNTANQLFLFFNKTESSSISIDNVSIREITNQAADFTFTRGSNLSATRIGPDGYIEKGRENLLLESNNFGTTWTNYNSTETGGQSGYDGSSDAWQLNKTGASGFLQQSISSTGLQTFSVYAKAGTFDFLMLRYRATSTIYYGTYFDLANELVGTETAQIINSTITSVGNGWYKCSITFNQSITQVLIYPSDVNGGIGNTSSGSIYIQDAQLEQGLVATDYIETGATTARAGVLEDEPRFDYTGGGCPALLMEPTRTNLIEQSEYFDHTSWIDTSATRDITITQVSETTPDGGSLAYKIQGTQTENQLAALNTIAIGDIVTNSIYVKRVSGTGDVRLRDVNNAGTNFSLDVADGWKRINVTGTATATTGRFYLNLDTYTDEILVWGAQQEKGSYATSYIPTYGTAATRAKEGAADSYDYMNLSAANLYSNTSYTYFLDINLPYDVGTSGSLWKDNDNLSTNGGFQLRKTSPTGSYVGITTHDGSAYQGFATNVLTGRLKIAIIYNNGEVSVYYNGVQSQSAISVTGWDQSTNHFKFGDGGNGTYEIQQFLYIPTVLSNNDCEILTGTSYTSFASMASTLSYTQYE